ncbi:MAG: bifunctional phosphopantothenoylcysteine decarboxylase/phosphopantothenate--cysteine ligase CoaBC, partial [Acidobacteriota bacterium]
MSRPRILLGVTGGIAAVKSAELVRRLIDRGAEVRCALTRSAGSFVTPLSLEVLSGHPVYEQEYLTATGSGEESHIVAAAWADAVCVAPATAHLIGRLALGLADDFLTTTLLAFTGPVVLAPAMHSDMWGQAAVAANVETLRRRGVRWAGPVEGPLASGEWGMGRLADVPDIIAAVFEGLEDVSTAVADGSLAGRRVLISAGPTHEPVDPVRYLGNRSSGKMGFALAAEAARRGARTTLVAGPVALATPAGVDRVDVSTALEMQAAIQ